MSKNKFRVIIFALFVSLLIVMELVGNRMYKSEFQAFYNTNMKGRITELNKHKGATDFKVDNIKQQFTFVPNDAGDKYFPEFAIPGDSIYKPAKSDTLRLVHHGKMYLFTFKKF
jgi:hypothetical protein